jgi:DHA1 family bicyclomycin/chloramphenicol resistance-like MFS transporter
MPCRALAVIRQQDTHTIMPSQTRLCSADTLADSAPIPHTQRWQVLAILSALMGFASISTDFYLPAMPEMANQLGADAGSVEFTISGFLIGFSLGQLFWGALSDKYGRKIPVAIGLVLFVIGSIGCAISTSVEEIILWRILQAIGACAGVVLSRAIVRDLYQGARAAQMLSTLIAVMAIAPLLGPILGSQIAAIAGWRAIFWVLVLLGLLALAGLFTLPETLPAERRRTEPLTGAFRRYADLLTHRKIIGYAGAGAFFYSGMYAYIAGTPFAFITYHKVPAEYYGLLFGAGIIGIVITNLINARLVHRFGMNRILAGGTVFAMISGIVLAINSYSDFGGLWGLFLPLLAFVSVTGFVVANSIAGAMADYPEQAGSVSALVGAIQYGSGIAGSGLVGALADGTPWPMGWVIAVMATGAALCAWLVTSTSSKSRQE